METDSVQVGNEMGSVEALWSQFENFMGKEEQRDEQSDETPAKDEDEDAGQDATEVVRE